MNFITSLKWAPVSKLNSLHIFNFKAVESREREREREREEKED